MKDEKTSRKPNNLKIKRNNKTTSKKEEKKYNN